MSSPCVGLRGPSHCAGSQRCCPLGCHRDVAPGRSRRRAARPRLAADAKHGRHTTVPVPEEGMVSGGRLVAVAGGLGVVNSLGGARHLQRVRAGVHLLLEPRAPPASPGMAHSVAVVVQACPRGRPRPSPLRPLLISSRFGTKHFVPARAAQPAWERARACFAGQGAHAVCACSDYASGEA